MIETRRLKNVVIFVQTTPKLYLCLKPFLKEYFGKKSLKSTSLWSIINFLQD